LRLSPHNPSRGRPGQRLPAFCLCLWLAVSGALAADSPSACPFTKPAPTAPPMVKNKAWPRMPVDAFILAKLEAAKRSPAPPVTAAWRSPLAGQVKVAAVLRDVDPNCGGGIIWAVKRGGEVLAKGELNNGGAAEFPEREITVAVGDLVQVTIGPRKEYTCDSTQLEFVIRAGDLQSPPSPADDAPERRLQVGGHSRLQACATTRGGSTAENEL